MEEMKKIADILNKDELLHFSLLGFIYRVPANGK